MTKLTMKSLEERIIELETLAIDALTREAALELRIKELESKPTTKGRDYGPKSTKKLDDLMAWRIKFGDRSGFSVKLNSEFFELSRGQVYSLDKYTFQHINEDSFTEADIPVDEDIDA